MPKKSRAAKIRKPMFASWEYFASWACGQILSEFIENGGKGLRTAVYFIVTTHRNWEREMADYDKDLQL